MKHTNLYKDILAGDYDDELNEIAKCINVRRKSLSNKKLYSFHIGQEVRFNDSCRPRYLIGARAIIKKLNRKTVTVDLVNPTARFNQNVRVPLNLIEV